MPGIGYEDAREVAAFYEGVLERARTIDAGALAHAEALTLESVVWDAEMAVEGLQHFWLEGVLTPYRAALRPLNVLFTTLPLRNSADVDHYLAQANMPAVTALVRANIQPVESGPYWPDAQRTSALDPDVIAYLQLNLAPIVEDGINPALTALADFLEVPYAAQAPEGVGLSQYPGGAEYYRYLTRLNTTMDLTPEEVQRVGYALLDEFETESPDVTP